MPLESFTKTVRTTGTPILPTLGMGPAIFTDRCAMNVKFSSL
jgi:hypothetical protein